jgi:hypothetical protein
MTDPGLGVLRRIRCVPMLPAQYLVDWRTLSANGKAEDLRFVGDRSILLERDRPMPAIGS